MSFKKTDMKTDAEAPVLIINEQQSLLLFHSSAVPTCGYKHHQHHRHLCPFAKGWDEVVRLEWISLIKNKIINFIMNSEQASAPVRHGSNPPVLGLEIYNISYVQSHWVIWILLYHPIGGFHTCYFHSTSGTMLWNESVAGGGHHLITFYFIASSLQFIRETAHS